jgi:hypothetical protein
VPFLKYEDLLSNSLQLKDTSDGSYKSQMDSLRKCMNLASKDIPSVDPISPSSVQQDGGLFIPRLRHRTRVSILHVEICAGENLENFPYYLYIVS